MSSQRWKRETEASRGQRCDMEEASERRCVAGFKVGRRTGACGHFQKLEKAGYKFCPRVSAKECHSADTSI